MFFYFIFCILWILSFWEIFFKYSKKLKNILNKLIVLLSVIISSIRTGPIGDWNAYKRVFLGINTSINPLESIFIIDNNSTEPLYKLFNYITKIIFDDFQAFIVVEAIFVNLFLYNFCTSTHWHNNNNSKKDYVITVFWIMWSLGLYNIIIVRQTLACMICWASISTIKNKDILKFTIYTIIASMIHRSALLWLPAYYIYRLDTNVYSKRICYYLKVFIGISILMIFFKLFSSRLPGAFGAKLTLYLQMGLISYGEAYSIWFLLFKSISNIFIVFLIILWLYRKNKHNETFRGYCNLYIWGSGIVIGSSFLSNELARLATPYSMLSVFIFTYLFDGKHLPQDRLPCFLFFSSYLAIRLYTFIGGYNLLATGYPTIW